MFIVKKSQEAKFEFMADELEANSREEDINKNMDNESLIAEIQKKPASLDPKDALHYFCILYIIFVYSTLFKYSFFSIRCIGCVAFKRTFYQCSP